MPVIYTNSLAKNNELGMGIYWKSSLQWPKISKTISTLKTIDVHKAKLVVIDFVILKLLYFTQYRRTSLLITIFPNNQGALQSLYNLYPRSGQFLLTQIILKIYEINIFNQSSVILE